MISFGDNIYTFCKFYAIAWYYILNKKKWPQYNRQRLAYILNYARIHSPYFSAIIGNVNIKEDNAKHVLQTLPQLSKDMIKKEPWHLYSDEIDSNWNLWRNTGATSPSSQPSGLFSPSAMRPSQAEIPSTTSE